MLTNQCDADRKTNDPQARSTRIAPARRLCVGLAVTLTAVAMTAMPGASHAADESDSQESVRRPYAVYFRVCSRSRWNVTTHDDAQGACSAAGSLREKNGQVFVMTGKPLEGRILHPVVDKETKLKSCLVYLRRCKSFQLRTADMTDAKEAETLAESLRKQGYAAEVVYDFADE